MIRNSKHSVHFFFADFNSTKSEELSKRVAAQIQKDNAKYIALFKSIHQNPELGFEETETAAIVAEELKTYGYAVQTKIAKTGVVGTLKNGNGPVVMYRSELDALPMQELTDLPYKSTKKVKDQDGMETYVAHTCGHDAHIVWLLSAAKFMAEHQDLWQGTLLMIAQPAEERIEGAEAMIKDGLYTTHGVPEPDYLYGLHTAPLATGMVAAATGLRMAGTDQIDVTFKGIGGHGSAPHLAKDPVMMATNAITQYQQIISRFINPQSPAVLTVGAIQAGHTNNVIPAEAKVKLNLRWYAEKERQLMLDGIKRINESVAHAYGLKAEECIATTKKGWSTPLDNSGELTKVVRQGLLKYMDIDLWTEEKMPAVMGSEDFHHLVLHNTKKKYCYVNIGIADPLLFQKSFQERQEPPFYNHNGNFEVDLDAIPIGTQTAIYGMLAIFTNYQ